MRSWVNSVAKEQMVSAASAEREEQGVSWSGSTRCAGCWCWCPPLPLFTPRMPVAHCMPNCRCWSPPSGICRKITAACCWSKVPGPPITGWKKSLVATWVCRHRIWRNSRWCPVKRPKQQPLSSWRFLYRGWRAVLAAGAAGWPRVCPCRCWIRSAARVPAGPGRDALGAHRRDTRLSGCDY